MHGACEQDNEKLYERCQLARTRATDLTYYDTRVRVPAVHPRELADDLSYFERKCFKTVSVDFPPSMVLVLSI